MENKKIALPILLCPSLRKYRNLGVIANEITQ
jgi:hypothetical protein